MSQGGIRASLDGPIGLICLDRPQRANAYTQTMLADMQEAFHDFVQNHAVRLIVVTGSTPGCFCAGADRQELAQRTALDAFNLRSARLFEAIAAAPTPVLAVIDGPAIGGGLELALACDVRVATSAARFAFPETALGVLPAAGGTRRLPAMVGVARAKEMILFGRELSASDALAWGLVNEVVDRAALPAAIARWADLAASRDPLAMQMAKRAIEFAQPDGRGEFATAAQALLYQMNADRLDASD
jgi:enoyl-CoA hydratase/carnithine racemase